MSQDQNILKLQKAIRDLKRFENQDIVVLGSGYSLSSFDFDSLKNKNIIAINHSFKYCNPFALCAMDSGFILNELGIKEDPEQFFQDQNFYSFFYYACRIFPKFEHSKVIKVKHSEKPEISNLINEKLYSQGLSGIMGLHLAVCLNPKRIFLLGYDCRVGSLTHFSDHEQNHKWKFGNSNNNYENKAERFNLFAKYKEKIYNVSLESKIKTFQKISFNEFYKLTK